MIWARVEHIGPHEFFTIVSAVPRAVGGANKVIVRTTCVDTRMAAESARDALTYQVANEVRQRGDRVVDVEDE